MKNCPYKPGDKIILFLPSKEPCIAWVCSEKLGGVIYRAESNQKQFIVKVSKHEDEAQSGKGQHISSSHMQPYGDVLWAACETWLHRGERHQDELGVLKKGTIPENYRIAFQLSSMRADSNDDTQARTGPSNVGE